MRSVSYEEWNQRLLNHYLRSGGGSVDELDVSEQELSAAGQVEKGVSGLMAAVRTKLHERKDLVKRWGFLAQIGANPEYFAFLVATCRIEWERESGLFATSLKDALKLDSSLEWIELLPGLWAGLVKYLQSKHDEDGWRQIVLPDHYRSFTRIGYSVGLVFPTRSDRRKLEEMFRDYSDREPPLADVIASLRTIMPQLSTTCRAEADRYCANAYNVVSDDRVRRFARVLRRSLLKALHRIDDEAHEPNFVQLCFWIDEDGFADPWLVLKDGAEVPNGFDVLPNATGLPNWSRVIQLTGADDSVPSALGLLRHDDDDCYMLLGAELRTVLGHGLIPLAVLESMDGDECLVPAVGDYQSERVLATLLFANHPMFKTAAAKSKSKMRIEGVDWVILDGNVLSQSDPKIVRLRELDYRIDIDGLRITGASFVATERFRPRVRCKFAADIRAYASNGDEILLRSLSDGISQIPPGIRGELKLVASTTDGSLLCKRKIDLTDRIPATVPAKWPAPNGAYWMASPCPRLAAQAGNLLPPWFASDGDGNAEIVPDTDIWENSEIWLGPRVGDVSATPLPGFEWRLTESDDQKERLLYYTGDINHPTAAVLEAISSHKGACRLWRRAFDPSQTKCLDKAWQQVFSAYSQLRTPETHRRLLGRSPEKYLGIAPPKVAVVENRQKQQVSNQVLELELILSARASARTTPFRWRQIQADFENAIGDQVLSTGLHAGDVIRAWQETGVFDAMGMPWQGTVIVPRKPRFLVRTHGRKLVSLLVGLANESLRSAVVSKLQGDWSIATKHSISPLVPPILEATCSSSDVVGAIAHLERLSQELGLNRVQTLPWRDTTELPPGITELKDSSVFFDKTANDLPATSPIWSRSVQGSEINVQKVWPRGQAPLWIVGPYQGRFAICTSPDWAWRLVLLKVANSVGFSYENGVFCRDSRILEATRLKCSVYLPLDVGRFLTIVSNSLPGPTSAGYEYAAPTDLTGRLIAKRLAVIER